MFDWPSLFRPPDAGAFDAWFARIAELLLNGSRLVVENRAHRLVEIEFYYSSPAHPDPFAHRDPIQFDIGHWYFHRAHGVHRGGSFKGFDLTFGNEEASGGVLIRGLEMPDGTLIDGPSLCVDYLLKATGNATVAELDRASNECLAWEYGNPLFLRQHESKNMQPWMRSPRVGLSLNRVASRHDSTRFLMLPYRYLTESRRTKKGKMHMVLALYVQGLGVEDIQRQTNCSQRVIERYVADFERGRNEADFSPFFGIDLGPSELCKLYGVWFAQWGSFHGNASTKRR